jgi:YtkA-like
MTMRLIVLAVIAAALAAPSAATAGGWATVGFDPPPEDLAPGEPWQVEMTILQHGVTPLDGVRPRVMVEEVGGGPQRSFPARATGEPGVYRATAVFGSAGTWRYVVDDGFMARHKYPPVQIAKDGKQAATEPAALASTAAAAPPSTGDGGPDYLLALVAAAVAAVAAGFGAALLQRRGGGANAAGG